MLIIALALGATTPSDEAQQALDRCIYATSKAWAAPNVDAELIADAAIVHCRSELATYVAAMKAEFGSAGMDAVTAEHAASGLAASTVRIARSFATDIVRKKQLGAQ